MVLPLVHFKVMNFNLMAQHTLFASQVCWK